MTVREKMKSYRCGFGLTVAEMARYCGVSEGLLRMVEDGDVTHPNIVHKIQEVYRLTDLEAEDLMPKNYRLHGGEYEPDKYILPETNSILPNTSVFSLYGAYAV